MSPEKREVDLAEIEETVERIGHEIEQKEDTHQKWIVALVSTAIVGLLAFFSVENYRLITARMEDQRNALTALMARGAERDVRITRLEANQTHILETLLRIEEKQDALLAKVRR